MLRKGPRPGGRGPFSCQQLQVLQVQGLQRQPSALQPQPQGVLVVSSFFIVSSFVARLSGSASYGVRTMVRNQAESFVPIQAWEA